MNNKMGQLVYIKAKARKETKLNTALKEAGIDNSFNTAKFNEEWLNNINSGQQQHLKPEDRNLTMVELVDMFPYETEIGVLSFDIAFGRTSEEIAIKYAKFIEENQDHLKSIKGFEAFLERYDFTPEQTEVIKKLGIVNKEPELLPVKKQNIPDLQSGLFLCKSWADTPFWVIFGNVERPMFLKEKKYKEDLYNNIYRDNLGFAYMLLPLLPMDNRQVDFVHAVYNQAYELGLREDFNFIIPLVYGLDLINLNEVAQDYKESYDSIELQDRFERTFKMTSSVYPYNGTNGIIWRDNKNRFVPIGGEGTMTINTRCSVLTALVRAIGSKESAGLMSKLTGKRYFEFEFK